ncbi:MAG: response regulator transcription factor [Prevotellaceae bacterium]|jgi:DNA-binding NarL/FixJ family response regulator|nr:response regulator transcription factor [Prevotellaceae bacterium]
MKQDDMIRVVIVDDHKVVADGFEHLINESGIAQVIGKTYSATGAWELLAKQQADVLLLDISLPDGNGIDLCPQIKAQYPNLKILMLTSYSELSIIMKVLEDGASGYILKNAMTEEIIEGIRIVASGERFLCEEVNILLKEREAHPIRLSRREQELLRLIVVGQSNNEIADKMCLGYETIKSYRKNLILKLNVHNTAQLVKIAIEQKLV